MYMQAPLGIYLKGEQKYEEIIEVLTHLTKYVPTVSREETVPEPGEELVKVTHDTLYCSWYDYWYDYCDRIVSFCPYIMP
jgi:hypothetical protein